MNSLRTDVTEAILRRAVIDAHERELAAIPPQSEIEYTPSLAHQARMNALFRREQRKGRLGTIRHVSRRAAVIFLVLTAAFFGILLTDYNVQATVRATIIRWYDNFTLFRFGGEAISQTETATPSELFPQFVPMGYELAEIVQFPTGRFIVFENDYGSYIVFQYGSADTVVAVDNEYTTMRTVLHNGTEFFVLTPLPDSEHRPQVIWQSGNHVLALLAELDTDVLLEMAFSVE